eukprot:Colp12_sorted_trinity150504_noHs@16070
MVGSVVENSTALEWTPDMEIHLFDALLKYKPVGIHKHALMVGILRHLNSKLEAELTAEQVWAHLETLYNLRALDEAEDGDLVNDPKDFSLPSRSFGVLLSERSSMSAEPPLEDTQIQRRRSRRPSVSVPPSIASSSGPPSPSSVTKRKRGDDDEQTPSQQIKRRR